MKSPATVSEKSDTSFLINRSFPQLTLIATPIGNLGDLTMRAEQALRECDAVCAEDTRRTVKLLTYLNLHKPLVSFHEHNEERRLPGLLQRLHAGERLALVTDAGTPSLSDPGFRLVSACIDAGISYTILPGASAITTALVGSGLPPLPFFFGGFLPSSGSKRRRELKKAVTLAVTVIYFESPYRLLDCLKDLAVIAPDSLVCVARELTKIHEEYRHGSPDDLAIHFSQNPARGEITLVISTTGDKKYKEKTIKNHSPKTPMPRNFE